MKKWNKKQLLISSLVIFVPMIVGFLLYNRLPDRLTTHWGASGNADGSMGKFAAITVIPTFIFVMHLFCLFMTHLAPKTETQSEKALLIVYWAMPVTSLFAGCMVLGSAMLKALNVMSILSLFLGLLFIIMGNYLPKCKQNSVLGIRLPWTLRDEENWCKTHRLGGYTFILGGVILLLGAFLPGNAQLPLMLIVPFALLFLTAVYSWKLSKKHLS